MTKEKKQRCNHCGKKELIIFNCSCCTKSFCIKHKMPEFHDCKSDYTNKENLRLDRLTTYKVDKI